MTLVVVMNALVVSDALEVEVDETQEDVEEEEIVAPLSVFPCFLYAIVFVKSSALGYAKPVSSADVLFGVVLVSSPGRQMAVGSKG